MDRLNMTENSSLCMMSQYQNHAFAERVPFSSVDRCSLDQLLLFVWANSSSLALTKVIRRSVV